MNVQFDGAEVTRDAFIVSVLMLVVCTNADALSEPFECNISRTLLLPYTFACFHDL